MDGSGDSKVQYETKHRQFDYSHGSPGSSFGRGVSVFCEGPHINIQRLSQGASGKANARGLNPGTFPAT